MLIKRNNMATVFDMLIKRNNMATVFHMLIKTISTWPFRYAYKEE